jgi:hypothetical protein
MAGQDVMDVEMEAVEMAEDAMEGEEMVAVDVVSAVIVDGDGGDQVPSG